MTNFKIVIEYDGSSFSGWQRQKNDPTVQETIEKALSRILNQATSISGSGRTDAGVHALGQVASFNAQTRLDSAQIKKGLNSLIKEPVVIKDCIEMPGNFHAQYSAVSKEYRYHILNRLDPCAVGRSFIWHIKDPLDITIMNECCQILLGIHNFKSFENTGSPRSSTIREIFMARVQQAEDDRLIFKVRASGFLKYMVRNLVGTLVWAGKKKITPDQFREILEACDRTLAGPTAPPQGLFLYRVNYS